MLSIHPHVMSPSVDQSVPSVSINHPHSSHPSLCASVVSMLHVQCTVHVILHTIHSSHPSLPFKHTHTIQYHPKFFLFLFRHILLHFDRYHDIVCISCHVMSCRVPPTYGPRCSELCWCAISHVMAMSCASCQSIYHHTPYTIPHIPHIPHHPSPPHPSLPPHKNIHHHQISKRGLNLSRS